jgi:hypothetical protein
MSDQRTSNERRRPDSGRARRKKKSQDGRPSGRQGSRNDRPQGGGSGGGKRKGGRSGGQRGRRPDRGRGPGSGSGTNGNGANAHIAGSPNRNDIGARGRSGTFEDLFATAGRTAKQIGLALRNLIMEVLPESEERVHLAWKIALYNDPNEVCGIQPVSKHCNLYFSNGARMKDPDGLLEGTGKSIRHVKVRSAKDMPVEQLKSLIVEAKRVAQ